MTRRRRLGIDLSDTPETLAAAGVNPEHTEGALWAVFLAEMDGVRVLPGNPAAACHYLHTAVDQGGSRSVFHRCRVKGCECREFSPLSGPDSRKLTSEDRQK